MDVQTKPQRSANSQLISVAHKDTVRLLEVYVKRSISLNDGTPSAKHPTRKEKWVTMAKRTRRSSSDPSLFLAEELNHPGGSVFSESEPSQNLPERQPEVSEKKRKKSKKSKKPSFWKNLLGFFSRKNDEDDDHESSSITSDVSEPVATCLPTSSVNLQNKSSRKKSLRRKLSKKLSNRSIKIGKDVNQVEIKGVEAVISVEPTYSYYEKVSEELEKIVHEVKENEEAETLSDAEVINRIIALIIEQGDAMDVKLKDNPTLSCFFQRMTYSSFQKLADAYLEKEATPIHNPPTVLPTAPELVKLAFTLDFTARIAGLSKQNVGHITCLGNRYLQDRFEYKQACTDHPWSDSDD